MDERGARSLSSPSSATKHRPLTAVRRRYVQRQKAVVCPSDLAFGDAEPCGNVSGRALILMLAFLHFPSTVGYAGVALLVGAESAGVPVPGGRA